MWSCPSTDRYPLPRVLGFDPGAERCGWAVVDDGPIYVASGIVATPYNNGERYQEYRLRLIDLWIDKARELIDRYEVQRIANELVPPVGGGNFMVAVQSQAVLSMLTVIQAQAMAINLPIHQYGSTTIKARIGGHKKATKVKVRNGVYFFFPELKESMWTEWVRVHDESDACAVALTDHGLRVPRNQPVGETA